MCRDENSQGGCNECPTVDCYLESLRHSRDHGGVWKSRPHHSFGITNSCLCRQNGFNFQPNHVCSCTSKVQRSFGREIPLPCGLSTVSRQSLKLRTHTKKEFVTKKKRHVRAKTKQKLESTNSLSIKEDKFIFDMLGVGRLIWLIPIRYENAIYS